MAGSGELSVLHRWSSVSRPESRSRNSVREACHQCPKRKNRPKMYTDGTSWTRRVHLGRREWSRRCIPWTSLLGQGTRRLQQGWRRGTCDRRRETTTLITTWISSHQEDQKKDAKMMKKSTRFWSYIDGDQTQQFSGFKPLQHFFAQKAEKGGKRTSNLTNHWRKWIYQKLSKMSKTYR